MFKFFAVFFLGIGLVNAVEQPQPDLNGYTAGYQHPILYPGDTLDAGWTGPSAYTIPAPADPSPTCSGASGVESGEYWIRDAAGMAELEQGTLGYRIFWVCPGDYRSSVGSTLNLADSGVNVSDGNIVKVMCWSSDMTKNPVQRNPNWRNNANGDPSDPNHDFTEECVLPKLNTEGQDYWFFHGITFGTASWTSANLTRIDDGTEGIVFDRTWFACYRTEPTLNGTYFPCVLFEYQRTPDLPQSDSRIQNSVVGPCSLIYDADMTGVGLEIRTERDYVVNTDIVDCGVGYITGGNDDDGTSEGNVLENSTLITTEHVRISACDTAAWYATGIKCSSGSTCGAGNDATSSSQRRVDRSTGGAQESLFDINGDCACMQQSMTIKKGSVNSVEPLRIINNRISGGRAQFARCGGDNGSRGYGIAVQEDPHNTLLQNNIWYDTRYIFSIASPGTGTDYDNIILRQNILSGFSIDDTDTVPTVPAKLIGYSPSFACPGCEVSFNSFAEAIAPTYADESDIVAAGNSEQDYNCNTFRGGATTDAASPPGQDNVAIDGASLWASLTNTQTITEVQAADQNFTFWDNLQTAPTQETISKVVPQPTSAYTDGCNVTPPTTDIRGLARTFPTSSGAFESNVISLPTFHYVNVGGPQYTDVSSNIWKQCDSNSPAACTEITYASGFPFANPSSIGNTPDPTIYQSIIFSENTDSIIGSFPVENGDYEVKLHLVEVVDAAPVGFRLFDIAVEGTTVATEVDIVVLAPGADTALILTYPVTVTDQNISIQLSHGSIENPVLAGVEIIEIVDTTPPNPAGSLQLDQTGSLEIDAEVEAPV